MLKFTNEPFGCDRSERDTCFIAEDNEEYAVKTIHELYSKFENIQMFPGIGAALFLQKRSRKLYS